MKDIQKKLMDATRFVNMAHELLENIELDSKVVTSRQLTIYEHNVHELAIIKTALVDLINALN